MPVISTQCNFDTVPFRHRKNPRNVSLEWLLHFWTKTRFCVEIALCRNCLCRSDWHPMLYYAVDKFTDNTWISNFLLSFRIHSFFGSRQILYSTSNTSPSCPVFTCNVIYEMTSRGTFPQNMASHRGELAHSFICSLNRSLTPWFVCSLVR